MTRSLAIQRVVLVVAALTAAAWLFSWLGDQRALTRAITVTDMYEAPRPALERGLRDAERAQRAGPRDTAADIERAKLLVALERRDEAVEVLERVVADEPENANAWALIEVSAGRGDPARAALARRRLAQLDPARNAR